MIVQIKNWAHVVCFALFFTFGFCNLLHTEASFHFFAHVFVQRNGNNNKVQQACKKHKGVGQRFGVVPTCCSANPKHDLWQKGEQSAVDQGRVEA